MRVCHWSLLNSSGMHNVAASMARAELALGAEAKCLDPFDREQKEYEWALDADVHVSHTHIPERIGAHSFKKSCTKPFTWVFPVHGTPELVFEMAVREGETNGFDTSTGFARHQMLMQQADAIFTFVPRHRDLYDLATDKHTIVDLIPMGMDLAFWQGGATLPKYQGLPSFLNCDNQYPFKWGVEILRMWPWIRQELDQAYLYVTNVPVTLQRFLDLLCARYGSLDGAVVGSWNNTHENLRNIFKQVDYYVSPVRYGDFNRMSLEAGAGGAKVISYPGNEYADYWMDEGDQRVTARDLIAIGKGDVAPRTKTPIPTEREMAEASVHVYERILDRPPTNFSLGEIPDALDPVMRDALLSVTGAGLNQTPPDAPRPRPLTLAALQAAQNGAHA